MEEKECSSCGKSWEKTYCYVREGEVASSTKDPKAGWQLCLKCFVREKKLPWTPEMEANHQRLLRGIPKGGKIKKPKCSWCADKIKEKGETCVKCHGRFCADCIEIPAPSGGCWIKAGYVCEQCKEHFLGGQ